MPSRVATPSARRCIASASAWGRLAARPGRLALASCCGGIGSRRDQRRILPDRLAVLAPVEREGPARQALARIPLALAVMQEAARGEGLAQAPDQRVGERPLGRADGPRVPLLALIVVDRHEGRLSAERQPHVLRGEIRIDPIAERVQRLPGLVGEGQGDARRFGDARHLHVEGEVDLGEARPPRRSARRIGTAASRRAACGPRR